VETIVNAEKNDNNVKLMKVDEKNGSMVVETNDGQMKLGRNFGPDWMV
jgi:hypothetical protein